MKWVAATLLGCAALAAQAPQAVPPPPASIARGMILERDTQNAGGEFSIRLATYEVLRYRYDARTQALRDGFPVPVPALRPGDEVEVHSEAAEGSLLRYAAAVRVTADLPEQAHRTRRNPADPAEIFGLSDPLFMRGDLALSGVVARVQPGRLVLHTREGERTILLREDTRYLENGELAGLAALRPNLRVFVRAGRNLYDEVEGYQVVWGSILEPK
jgi:hypothetical protein